MESLVQTPVQPVMFQTVDLRLDRLVLMAQSPKRFLALSLFLTLVELASLGHDNLRNVEFQQFPVILPGKPFVEAQADDVPLPVSAQQSIRQRNGRSRLRPTAQTLIVQNQSVLVGRQEQRMAQFHRWKKFAFRNPLGVRFEERKYFFG